MMNNWVQRRSTERDVERRARQVKEIVRLGTMLRAEMDMDRMLGQVVESINSTIGFHAAGLNLVREESEYVAVVATAGLGEAERQRLLAHPPQLQQLIGVMRPEFCISHSYFISHHHRALLEMLPSVPAQALPTTGELQRAADAWHPLDVLLVPLVSPRTGRMLGILSLDQPLDGKIPTFETIEIIELFADQAALAIDTAQLFAEREQERRTLEAGLFDLLYHLEQVRQGNLAVRVDLPGTILGPMAGSLNAVIETLGAVLADVRSASEVVNQHASEIHGAAGHIATNAQQQAERILEVSRAMERMAQSVRRIAETANGSMAVAGEAIDISHAGREAAEEAARGMSQVREVVLQSAKRIKRLGESSQEIGNIVDMVSDFANQTNLLALNAAIEAVRAGEHGRGFALVAHEIRNLANSSAEATKQISARVKGIQAETQQVGLTIEHSTERVVLQSDLATQAGAALEAVDAVTQRIASAIASITETAKQQAHAALLIARAMDEIASVSAQTRDGMHHTSAAMEHLVKLAHTLLEHVGHFRLAEGRRGPALLAEPRPGASQPGVATAQWAPNPAELATEPMPAARRPISHPLRSATTQVLPRSDLLNQPPASVTPSGFGWSAVPSQPLTPPRGAPSSPLTSTGQPPAGGTPPPGETGGSGE